MIGVEPQPMRRVVRERAAANQEVVDPHQLVAGVPVVQAGPVAPPVVEPELAVFDDQVLHPRGGDAVATVGTAGDVAQRDAARHRHERRARVRVASSERRHTDPVVELEGRVLQEDVLAVLQPHGRRAALHPRVGMDEREPAEDEVALGLGVEQERRPVILQRQSRRDRQRVGADSRAPERRRERGVHPVVGCGTERHDVDPLVGSRFGARPPRDRVDHVAAGVQQRVRVRVVVVHRPVRHVERARYQVALAQHLAEEATVDEGHLTPSRHRPVLHPRSERVREEAEVDRLRQLVHPSMRVARVRPEGRCLPGVGAGGIGGVADRRRAGRPSGVGAVDTDRASVLGLEHDGHLRADGGMRHHGVRVRLEDTLVAAPIDELVVRPVVDLDQRADRSVGRSDAGLVAIRAPSSLVDRQQRRTRAGPGVRVAADGVPVRRLIADEERDRGRSGDDCSGDRARREERSADRGSFRGHVPIGAR